MTKEDQAHINEFSKLNVKFHEIEDDLKAKQEMLVNLQDSSNEVCLAALLLLHTHAFCAHRIHLCMYIYQASACFIYVHKVVAVVVCVCVCARALVYLRENMILSVHACSVVRYLA